MPAIIQLLICSTIGGLLSLTGGIILITLKKRQKIAEFMTAFAAGALLAAAFIDVLPEAAENGDIHQVLLWSLTGIIIFFLLESCIGWFHKHSKPAPDQHDHQLNKAAPAQQHTDHQRSKTSASQHVVNQHNTSVSPVIPMAIIGDTLHNFIDGIAIAAAFLVSPTSGAIVTLVVAAHEIPQEIGDFGLLLYHGLSRKKVILINILSSLATVFAASTFFLLGNHLSIDMAPALGLVAGFFIYIAASDIIPTIHDSKTKKIRTQKILMLLAGIIIVSLAITLFHHIAH